MSNPRQSVALYESQQSQTKRSGDDHKGQENNWDGRPHQVETPIRFFAMFSQIERVEILKTRVTTGVVGFSGVVVIHHDPTLVSHDES